MFNAANPCIETNALAFVALNLLYKLIGDKGISVLIKSGTSICGIKFKF